MHSVIQVLPQTNSTASINSFHFCAVKSWKQLRLYLFFQRLRNCFNFLHASFTGRITQREKKFKVLPVQFLYYLSTESFFFFYSSSFHWHSNYAYLMPNMSFVMCFIWECDYWDVTYCIYMYLDNANEYTFFCKCSSKSFWSCSSKSFTSYYKLSVQ